METLKKSFGRRFRALREARGFSREALAQNVEIDPTSIYRLENGDQWIAPEKLEAAARFFNVSPAVFFTDDVVKVEPTPQEALEVLARAIAQPKSDPQPALPPEMQERFSILQDAPPAVLAMVDGILEGLAETRKKKSSSGTPPAGRKSEIA